MIKTRDLSESLFSDPGGLTILHIVGEIILVSMLFLEVSFYISLSTPPVFNLVRVATMIHEHQPV